MSSLKDKWTELNKRRPTLIPGKNETITSFYKRDPEAAKKVWDWNQEATALRKEGNKDFVKGFTDVISNVTKYNPVADKVREVANEFIEDGLVHRNVPYPWE